MEISKMRIAAVIVALCLVGAKAQAQVLQPTAVSARSAVTHDQKDPASHNDRFLVPRSATGPIDTPPSRKVRIKPIVIGVIAGALIGAGAGELVGAEACEGLHCSTRHEVITGTVIGAAVGGLFGLVLALPPKDH
jgi:hypothetical protein